MKINRINFPAQETNSVHTTCLCVITRCMYILSRPRFFTILSPRWNLKEETCFIQNTGIGIGRFRSTTAVTLSLATYGPLHTSEKMRQLKKSERAVEMRGLNKWLRNNYYMICCHQYIHCFCNYSNYCIMYDQQLLYILTQILCWHGLPIPYCIYHMITTKQVNHELKMNDVCFNDFG